MEASAPNNWFTNKDMRSGKKSLAPLFWSAVRKSDVNKHLVCYFSYRQLEKIPEYEPVEYLNQVRKQIQELDGRFRSLNHGHIKTLENDWITENHQWFNEIILPNYENIVDDDDEMELIV